HSGLARMAGIALRDGNNGEKPGPPRFVTPDAPDIGNSCGLQLLPDQSRTHEAAHVIEFAWGTRRRRPQNNRIVSMIEAFHLHDGLRTHRTGIVTGPFPERPFVPVLAGNGLAFDDYLGMRGKWKPGVFPFDDRNRPALQAADPVVFGNAPRHFDPTRQIDQRVLSERDRYFASFAPGKVLLAHHPAVLSGRNIE